MRKGPRLAALLMLIAVAPLPLGAQGRRVQARQSVLFVCEHGTVRSILAKLLFEEYAREIGLDVGAVARATRPDSTMPAWMRQKLATDKLATTQIALGMWRPQLLSADDLSFASYVVAFDVPPSATAGARARPVQWDGLPSVSADYAVGRDAIKVRVHALADSLKRLNVRNAPAKLQ